MWVGRDVTTEDVDSLVKYAKRGVLVSDVPVSQSVLDALTALVFAKKPTQDLVDAVYTAFWSTNVVKEWSEDNVVRDENGRFASGGGTAYSDVPKADFKNETTRDAIEWYINGGSSTLNTALRRPELLPGSGYEQDVERYGSALLDAVNNSSLPEAITVQRMLPLEAVGGDPEELVGRVITDEGFMSTATMRDADGDKVDQWKNYGSGSYNARLVIEVPAGAKALGINTGESEVLLPPNTRVEIFETREVPGGVDLHGRVVVDSPVAKEWNEANVERDELGRFASSPAYFSAKDAFRDMARFVGVGEPKELLNSFLNDVKMPDFVPWGSQVPSWGKTQELVENYREYLLGLPEEEREPKAVGDMYRALCYASNMELKEDGNLRANSFEEVGNRLSLADAMDSGHIVVAINPEDFEQVLADSAFLNQYDTGTSNGMYDPDWRSIQEYAVLDVPLNTLPEERPIYGAVFTDEQNDKDWNNIDADDPYAYTLRVDNPNLEQYGSWRVELKDDVRERTTVTLGDSLTTSRLAQPINSELTEEAFTVMGGYRSSNMFINSSAYVEAQVHGGVSIDDIARIHVPTEDVTRVVEMMSDAGGVQIPVVGYDG